ncbi:hypothetical protein [Chitinophaga rhizosphaerae]|uniref:hypothetical protein n=1 Tax=Chitinophaga rhizosphaerae TaxID=1864947 RepID=UPI000F80439F|nr:hypothetical protein [Chitinophaga rhizosphaerae]
MKKILLFTLFSFIIFSPGINMSPSNAAEAKAFSYIYGFKSWDDYPHSPAPASYTVELNNGGTATMAVYGDPLDPDYIMVNGYYMDVTSSSHFYDGLETIEERHGTVLGTPIHYEARKIYNFLLIQGWYGSL